VARNESKRQKKLLKKKRKDKDRKNKQSEMLSGVKSSKSIIKNARELEMGTLTSCTPLRCDVDM
jgi:hypothetical protein